MWVIQVFSTSSDELVAERQLGSVDQDFLTQLQRAADWLYARKVLPGQVRITDCVATV